MKAWLFVQKLVILRISFVCYLVFLQNEFRQNKYEDQERAQKEQGTLHAAHWARKNCFWAKWSNHLELCMASTRSSFSLTS